MSEVIEKGREKEEETRREREIDQRAKETFMQNLMGKSYANIEFIRDIYEKIEKNRTGERERERDNKKHQTFISTKME